MLSIGISRSCVFAVALTIASVVGAWAQFETATLTGSVTDPAGAAIAGASVRLRNEATNTEVSSQTDDDGRYTFNAVRPTSTLRRPSRSLNDSPPNCVVNSLTRSITQIVEYLV